MIHEWFVYQIRIHVDGAENICCTICKWFVCHSLRTKSCSFLQEHKGNCPHRVDRFFHLYELLACCLYFWHFFDMDWWMFVECVLKLWFTVCSPHVHGKLNYCTPSVNCTQTAQHDQGTHVCTKLYTSTSTEYKFNVLNINGSPRLT